MYHTEQETFWAGHFGDEYVERNQGGRGSHLILPYSHKPCAVFSQSKH